MKKNIQINICGTIYYIDEDAYQLLENYLQSMKNYFRNQEGGEEIADDIEHRVAELLWEAKQNGMEAVNIETIKDIMNKVGNPAEIDGEASAAYSAADSSQAQSAEYAEYTETQDTDSLWDKIRNHMRDHRLYRDVDNKMIGGVIAGLAGYVGKGDVTLWRLATVVAAFCFASIDGRLVPDFIHFLIPVAYILMLIVVPVAKSPEDRLRMKGKKINPENIKNQVVSDSEEQEAASTPRQSSSNGGCLRALLWIVALTVLIPLFMAFFGIMLSLIVLLPITFGLSTFTIDLFPNAEWITEIASLWGPLLWIMLIALLIVVTLPINFIVDMLRGKNKSVGFTLSALFIWIIAVAVATGAAIYGGARTQAFMNKKHEAEATRNGVTLFSKGEWERLGVLGWDVSSLKNARKALYEGRTGYAGLPHGCINIERDDKTQPITFSLDKSEYYDEGTYVMESLTGINGRGVIIKATDDKGNILATINPDNAGDELSSMSWQQASTLPILHNPDSTGWDHFAKETCNWKYHVSPSFHHNGGTIKITISTQTSQVNTVKVRQIQLRKTTD